MKINFTVWALDCCGGNRAIFEVSNRLVERGHDVSLTSFGKTSDSSWFNPVKAEIVTVEESNVMRVFRKFVLNNKFKYDLDRALADAIPECDVNVATFGATALPTYLSGKGKRFHYIQNDDTLFAESVYLKRTIIAGYYLPLKKLVVSKWLLKMFGEWDPTYVGNGVNLDTFHPSNNRVKRNHDVVLSFLRGIEWKGDDTIVETSNIIRRTHPKLNPAFVFLASKNQVLTDGDLASLYRQASVFVSAPWIEGFGLYNLESMACGTPVVTTDTTGTKDYAQDGFNALVVPPKNPEKLAEAIAHVLTDKKLREKLVRNGFETAKLFSWDKVVDRMEKAFNSCESLS